jgi:hypothetical protein
MARKPQASDLYMNFATLQGAYASTATNLVEVQVNTGLSIRGALIWLIHQVEFEHEAVAQAAVDIEPRYALSTRQGLSVMPGLGDDGVISAGRQLLVIVTSGAMSVQQPQVAQYLPPVPIATPQLSLYLIARVANAAVNSKAAKLRIGFTTAPLDSAVYTEIAEAWGW